MIVKAVLQNNTFEVSQDCDVEILISCGENLEEGDTLEVQFPNSWLLVSGPSHTRGLQTRDPERPHYIAVDHVEDPGTGFKLKIEQRNLYFPGGKARHGRHITAKLLHGLVRAGETIKFCYANTRAPYISETENLWIRVKGNPPEAAPRLTTVPGEAERIRVLVPSGVEPGEKFDCHVVSLDKFENCSRTKYSGLSLHLDDGTLIEKNIRFTGSIRIPVSIEKEGVYRFSVCGEISNAVKVKKGNKGPYWGDIHIHTKLSYDAQGGNPYEYARNTSSLDFAATTDHWSSLGEKGIRQTAAWAENAYMPGKFVTIPGYERNPVSLQGHHNVYFKTVEGFLKKALIYSADEDDLKQRAKNEWFDYTPDSVIMVPHHTGILFSSFTGNENGNAIDINAADDRGLRPAAEIYSIHGQSELYSPQHFLAYEINRMRNPERRANTSVPGPFYLQDYWKQGRKIGVIASSDEHSGQGGRRRGGIAAVKAPLLTREGIFEAIRGMRCYATTGERILLEFNIEGAGIGETKNISAGTEANIVLKTWGTESLLRVEILRYRFGIDENFQPVESHAPRNGARDHEIRTKEIIEHDTVFYGRVVQEPLDWPGMAWTTPIWINCEPAGQA